MSILGLSRNILPGEMPVKKTAAALAAVLLLHAAGAMAADYFPSYVNGANPLDPAYLPTDKIPVIRGNRTYRSEASRFLTDTAPQVITNKTIDCAVNTCTNFPGVAPPADCSGANNALQYTAAGGWSCVTIAGVVSAGDILLNNTGDLLLNAGGDILLN